ncbi:MAG TPA: dienelactone hydrolase family protein [Bryobacteraceae bacterium]|jgi:carboxymethylenebutenolidase|nr:dienelactone hydrolase family protein [Bryobacteraceae bacterium]
MAEENQKNDELMGNIARREFVVASVAAAGIAATAATAEAATEVVENNVEIKTPDGTCDAAFIHPKSGSHPAVVIWTDIFGLRPAFREMGKRLAAEGYSVLVPNPYYRKAKAPVVDDPTKFDFQKDMAKMTPLMASFAPDGAIESDATAFIGFLDAQKQVNKSKKVGTQGYCMGGPLVFRTCAGMANRVGAGATFHGGGLVSANPNSPHLMIPKFHDRMYIAIASNDDMRQPDAKDKLKEAFAAAKIPAEVEVYTTCQHGWCVPDMPLQNGMPIYNKPEAERAWGKLLALYKTALA